MSTQISFTADPKLKEQALQKANAEGISLKTLLVYAMKGFVDGKISLSITTEQYEPEVEEIFFNDPGIIAKSKKIAKLLK